jgi:tRNA G18 (ribose-2'-O)-methylase SpoU
VTRDEDSVGVGPWVGPWPDDPRLDPALLRDGDRRNVLDQYRYWTVEAIVEELDSRRHPLQVAIENWQHDLNIGSIVRTANAFNVAAVHIVGKRRWNRRGAMVTDRYVDVIHHATVDDLVRWCEAVPIPLVGVDNTAGAVPIEKAQIPEAVVLFFGQEGPGLTPGALKACTGHLSITQYGSTRSINAAAAAAIAMHAWVRQHAVIG